MRECDFLPANYRERVSERRTLRRRACFVVVMIALMGVWLGLNRREIATANELLDGLNDQREQIGFSREHKDILVAEKTRLEARQHVVEMLQEHVSLVVLLADLSARMPPSVALISLNLAAPPIGPATEAAPAQPDASRSTAVEKIIAPPSPAAAPAPAGSRSSRLRMTLRGLAKSAPDVMTFAAALEQSKLVDRVQMQLKGSTDWGGRQTQLFELSYEILPQHGARR